MDMINRFRFMTVALTLLALLMLAPADVVSAETSPLGSLSLDGDGDYVLIPHDDALNPRSTMSIHCLLSTSPSPRDLSTSRMPSSA